MGGKVVRNYRMQGIVYTIVVAFFARVGEASCPTACSAYETCAGLQGDCCPNMAGINLACCFSGALMKDAAAAKKEADAAKKQQEAAAKKAKAIQAQIEDLNAHATAAQKRANQAAREATNEATGAAKEAMMAEAAAAHAKKLEKEQEQIVA